RAQYGALGVFQPKACGESKALHVNGVRPPSDQLERMDMMAASGTFGIEWIALRQLSIDAEQLAAAGTFSHISLAAFFATRIESCVILFDMLSGISILNALRFAG